MIWLVVFGALALCALVAVGIVLWGAYEDKPRDRPDAPGRD